MYMQNIYLCVYIFVYNTELLWNTIFCGGKVSLIEVRDSATFLRYTEYKFVKQVFVR